MTSGFKHRQISQKLAEEISAGKYPPGSQIPSEHQLVQRFKVSRPTVGRALRELKEQGLIERHAGSGTYVLQPQTQGACVSSLRQLGLIVPDLKHTEIFEPICGELAALSRAHGYGLLWGGILRPHVDEYDMSAEEADAFVGQLIQCRAEGVFFVPFEHRADSQAVNERMTTRLRRAGIPVVLIDRDIVPYPRRSDFDLVGVDNFYGGYALAEHLLKAGARQLAYVARPHTAGTVSARIAGAQSALTAHEAPPLTILQGDPCDPAFVRTVVRVHKAEGLLCTSDHVAAQFLQTATRMGVRVPQEVRLVGFDDTPVASVTSVPLTTMAQPCRDIATIAFHALHERIQNPPLPPRLQLLTPQLVVRESSGAFASSRRT